MKWRAIVLKDLNTVKNTNINIRRCYVVTQDTKQKLPCKNRKYLCFVVYEIEMHLSNIKRKDK